jgi:uncharacterized membrane protein
LLKVQPHLRPAKILSTLHVPFDNIYNLYMARWMEELSQYDMVIKHRPGKNHGNADGLSRIVEDEAGCPNYLSGVELKNLPCRGGPS